MNIKLYIVNLAEYTNGELVGKWIELPMNVNDLKKEIAKILGSDEEPVIHDYESPFNINEYDNIYKINEIAERLSDINLDRNIIEKILDNFCNIEEGINVIENEEYILYDNCESMSDVAYEIVHELGFINEIPESLSSYFDYEAFGRDLEIERTFLYAGNGTYVEIIW
ncbi:hypothetical protein B7C51_25075 (plasmid) [Paenibacillus larvae subsp. pulvifaciens]|uniref:Antirestriction protein ArdA n=1 Tax=Paenibacillus larvae subsp. pulvifaciens TaxID=1477 RepID=A0A1V0UZZ4_9BACL|nr:antirestriction protein ArdA [Paenibacillus larvae]ARF70747.1 hypothetical protein B7C51_25075 [Paenibacillus larvae subsp. pulvifaciens]